LPVRKKLYAKEGFAVTSRDSPLASGDPIELIQSFSGGPRDDVCGNSIWPFQYVVKDFILPH